MDDNEYQRLNQLYKLRGPEGIPILMFDVFPTHFFGRWWKSIPYNCNICNRPASISPNKFGSSANEVYHCAPCYNDYLRWLERFRRENPQWAALEDERKKYPINPTAGTPNFTDAFPPKKKSSFWI